MARAAPTAEEIEELVDGAAEQEELDENLVKKLVLGLEKKLSRKCGTPTSASLPCFAAPAFCAGSA